MTFLEVGFGGNLVQGFRAYAWRAVPSFPQIALWDPSLAFWPQPLLLHGLGKFVPGISRPLPNKSKLKFDQNFKVFVASALNYGVDWIKVLDALGPLCPWQYLSPSSLVGSLRSSGAVALICVGIQNSLPIQLLTYWMIKPYLQFWWLICRWVR